MIKKILRKNRFTSKLLETYFFSKKYLNAKGWYESRFSHQSIDESHQAIPWFTYSSIHFLKSKLIDKKFDVFEFGAGNSTIWFSERVNSIHSIEHDGSYAKFISPKLNEISNVTFEYSDLNLNYTTRILDFENKFDIIIIDGRERVKCTYNSIKAIKDNGIIIFDNSDRKEYQKAYDLLRENKFKKIDFKGLAPISHSETQTTIFYKNVNCLDI